ncbi:duf699-domain-containing protein [Phaffia rhodozyma]|uniref:RNA cytidine acetyltransferase n=1 Tax=Phaffia rhodozyma TaxID=264483 RepID=A0A0F7SQA9_PHARH|nr:duf699-domain-containing protein [Phaffia rhodozyma]
MRKQLDSRIPALITNNVASNHRSFFVLVGDKGRDQVVNLHFLLSQTRVSARPNVLWCYKKDLGFTSHRKKREAKIKRDVKRGIREANEQSPFELFVGVTDIRYTYYKDSAKILGQTFGMLVLQDFEAVTPNLLARTVETVEGGGIVVLLLRTMSSLQQLYTMSMDVHARYRTASHNAITARFNERFILSLGSCDDCLVLDDELNVLPISKGKDIVPNAAAKGKLGGKEGTAEGRELRTLKDSLDETKIVGDLVKLTRTVDQAKAILTFLDAITTKTLSTTVTLTAPRGRGKSAALGLSIAASLAHGYSNIFVTSPSPENLKTLFEFIFKGLDALGYEEHQDYDIVQSTKAEWQKAVVRVNVFKGHRQTIQYIQPQDAHVLGQAELLIIDEAAAIPLPLVRNLIGPYLIFMASTINGYEGTGRSLSLKLVKQLREATTASGPSNSSAIEDAKATTSLKPEGSSGATLTRSLKEIKLEEPIRYSHGDKVEKWLNTLLCLDASIVSKHNLVGYPHPSKCQLYHVSRDTLFSFHPASELFLQRMMALYVSSHYKNSPNDLQLMSDAPAHELFVLLPPIGENENTLPEPLVVVQVAMEGRISKEVIMTSLSQGLRSGGDLIPWLMAQQFQDDDFAMLSGARVVRIATHPDYSGKGYGARALEELSAFYSGELSNLDDLPETNEDDVMDRGFNEEADLLTENVSVRSPNRMPPLLQRLSERRPPQLDYIGVSYGLTSQLLRFWKKAGYVPLYLRQTPNELTGEHSCVMLKTLGEGSGVGKDEEGWLGAFAADFRKRFLSLLSYKFREFNVSTSMSIIEAASAGAKRDESHLLAPSELPLHLTPFDIKRLESYANNTLDYHVILDLLPTLATFFFDRKLERELTLSPTQASILLGLGLQRKSIEEVAVELPAGGLPVNQALALFIKSIRKLSSNLQTLQKKSIESTLAPERSAAEVFNSISSSTNGGKEKAKGATDWKPIEMSVEDELKEAGTEEERKLREMKREMINSLDLKQYEIDSTETDWTAAQAHVDALTSQANEPGKGRSLSTVVSVKSTNPAPGAGSADGNQNSNGKSGGDKKRKADDIGGGKKKKKVGGKK